MLLPILRIGVPAYMHDWTWPPDAAGLRAQLLQGWEPWLDDGLGRPNPFPTAFPFFVVMGWSTALVPSRVELALLLFAVTIGAFAAATAYARRVYGLRGAAYVCGALYAAGPVLLTKLVAGHLPYLEAYAAFPVFALALREARTSRRWLAAGALAAAFTALQPQFLGFDALYALVALATRTTSPSVVLRLGALALPVLVPVLVGPTVNALGGEGYFAQQHAVVAWERDQSGDLLESLAGIGYFTHYVARLSPPGAVGLFTVFPLLALGGIAAGWKVAETRTLLAAAVGGWLIVVGLNGPLAPLFAALFANVTPVSLFRELYDASVLLWFPTAVLAGLAAARLGRLAAAPAALAALAALVPPWASYGGYFMAPPAPARLAQISHAVAGAALGPTRVVWWPALQPMGPPAGESRGTDPLARTPLDGALPLYQYQPQGANGEAVSLAANGRWSEAANVFAQLGVGYVVVRDGLESFASGAPRATIAPGPALQRLAADGGFTVYRVPAARALVSVESPVSGGPLSAPHRYVPSRTEATAAPDRIVAAFPYAWRSPAAGGCGADSVIGGGAVLARAGGAWVYAAPLDAATCRWLPAAALAAQRRTLFVAGGWADAPQPVPAVPARSLAAATSVRERPGRWEATVAAPRDALLVVRVAYDRRWRARADGRDLGTPLRWFDFVAWPIATGRHAVVATYGGAPPVFAALTISLAGMVALVVLICLPEPRPQPPR